MKKYIWAALICAAGSTAQANIIETTINAPANGVGYLNFGWTGGFLSIRTITATDPELFLFAGSTAGALVAFNDDGGVATLVLPPTFNFFDSLITGNFAAGSYVLALGRFNLTESEARSGVNTGASALSATVRLNGDLNRVPGTISVPEPATLALLGLGLAGLGLLRRKRSP